MVFSQSVSTPEDTALPVTLQGQDPNGDPLTYAVTQPTHGMVTLAANVATYTPTRYYKGSDSFTYTATDGVMTSPPATISITVTPVNHAPVANPDMFAALPNAAADSGNVLANDDDIDGVGISVASFTQPAHGTVKYLGNGVFRYLAAQGFTGLDRFSYTITDPRSYQSTTGVTVAVGTASLAGSWTTYGNNAQHTGYFPGSVLGSNIVPGWTVHLGGTVNPVVVDSGNVYLTRDEYSTTEYADALNASNGSVKWEQSYSPAFSMNPPTFDNGHIFFQRGNSGSDTAIWSINASNGTTAWKTPHDAQWESYKAPDVAGGDIFVDGGTYGGIYGFNESTGTQLFFNSALAQESGWTPTFYDGEVYEVTGNRLAAHNIATGAIDWSVGYLRTDYTYAAPTATITNGWAYIATGSDLCGINLSTHTVGWDEKVSSPMTAQPTVLNGLVYLGVNAVSGQPATAGSVEAFNAATGASVTTYAGVAPGQVIVTDDAVISSPANAGGLTTIFDKASGTVLATLPASGSLSLADNVLYLVSNGAISTFDFQPPVAKPWAAVVGATSVAEGSPLSLSAATVAGATSYQWDFNYNNSTFVTDASGQNATFSAAKLDGPSTRLAALHVTTATGADVTAFAMSVTNVAPTAVFSGSTVTLGQSGTVTFSNASDPSGADTSAGFTYSYDFNDDGSYDLVSTSPTAIVPRSYLTTTGAHTVAGRITDKDGGYTTYTTTIQVNSPPPDPKLSGTVIGTSGSYNNSGNTAAKAFDGNLVTYFDGPNPSGDWVGLDLGSAKVITRLAYASRNGWASRMNGGVFQASNSSTFTSGVVNLYTISANANPTWTALTHQMLNNTTAYRYVRYYGPANSDGDVAEVQFFGHAPAITIDSVRGTVTGTRPARPSTSTSTTIPSWTTVSGPPRPPPMGATVSAMFLPEAMSSGRF